MSTTTAYVIEFTNQSGMVTAVRRDSLLGAREIFDSTATGKEWINIRLLRESIGVVAYKFDERLGPIK